MKFTVLTLFPDLIHSCMETGITGRALTAGHFSLETVNIRDFADNRYAKVDDRLAGGGTGMLMMCEPIHKALHRHPLSDMESRGRRIYLSPKGQTLNQALVEELSQEEELILLCGHYEGIDSRLLEEEGFEEISLGDFVLTGGELGACVLMDAVSRLLPGVLPNREAFEQESHYDGRLEEKQYTKPNVWQGREIPDVLLSGHHKNMVEWKFLSSLEETLNKRPDLFDQLDLSVEDYLRLAVFLTKDDEPDEVGQGN